MNYFLKIPSFIRERRKSDSPCSENMQSLKARHSILFYKKTPDDVSKFDNSLKTIKRQTVGKKKKDRGDCCND